MYYPACVVSDYRIETLAHWGFRFIGCTGYVPQTSPTEGWGIGAMSRLCLVNGAIGLINRVPLNSGFSKGRVLYGRRHNPDRPGGQPAVNGEWRGSNKRQSNSFMSQELIHNSRGIKITRWRCAEYLPYLQLNTLPNYNFPHLCVLFQFLTVELNPSGFSFVELLVVITPLSGKMTKHVFWRAGYLPNLCN